MRQEIFLIDSTYSPVGYRLGLALIPFHYLSPRNETRLSTMSIAIVSNITVKNIFGGITRRNGVSLAVSYPTISRYHKRDQNVATCRLGLLGVVTTYTAP